MCVCVCLFVCLFVCWNGNGNGWPYSSHKCIWCRLQTHLVLNPQTIWVSFLYEFVGVTASTQWCKILLFVHSCRVSSWSMAWSNGCESASQRVRMQLWHDHDRHFALSAPTMCINHPVNLGAGQLSSLVASSGEDSASCSCLEGNPVSERLRLGLASVEWENGRESNRLSELLHRLIMFILRLLFVGFVSQNTLLQFCLAYSLRTIHLRWCAVCGEVQLQKLGQTFWNCETGTPRKGSERYMIAW